MSCLRDKIKMAVAFRISRIWSRDAWADLNCRGVCYRCIRFFIFSRGFDGLQSRFDKTVFEPLSPSASEESSIFSSDTLNLHLNKAISSVRPRKVIFFLFLKIKGFYQKTVYIRLIIYLKATYGKKKWKKSNFQLLPLNTQTLLTVTLKLLGTLIQI